MDNHGHDHGGAPEPRAFSHPVLWTIGLIAIMGGLGWVFFNQLNAGARHAQGEPRFAMPAKAVAGPDHAALIADRSQAVLDRGELLYGKNCVSCHGPTGEGNPANINPPPRQFRTEGLKNPLGNGPYAWFKSLSDGYGAGMPAFRSLPPADRYAIAHFIRERWVKPANPPFYAEADPEAVAKQIPAAGSAGAAEAKVDVASVKPPKAVYGVMARTSAADARGRAGIGHWLDRAAADVQGPEATLLARLRILAEERPVLADRLRALAGSASLEDVSKQLAASGDPVLALARTADLNRLAARLITAAASKG